MRIGIATGEVDSKLCLIVAGIAILAWWPSLQGANVIAADAV